MSLLLHNPQTLHRYYNHLPMNFESNLERESERYSIASGSMVSQNVSSATSYAVSMCSPSLLSVMSVTSDMQFFKNEFGRQLNNYSDVYRLPADVEEFNQLGILKHFISYHLLTPWIGKKHGMFIDIIGQKYVPGMEEAMANDVPGNQKPAWIWAVGQVVGKLPVELYQLDVWVRSEPILMESAELSRWNVREYIFSFHKPHQFTLWICRDPSLYRIPIIRLSIMFPHKCSMRHHLVYPTGHKAGQSNFECSSTRVAPMFALLT